MELYEEDSQAAILQKKKAVRYEEIRLEEETKGLEEEKGKLDEEQAKIDELIFNDTKEEHIKKRAIQDEIEEIDKKLEELQRQLQHLESEKRSLQLEVDLHQK